MRIYHSLTRHSALFNSPSIARTHYTRTTHTHTHTTTQKSDRRQNCNQTGTPIASLDSRITFSTLLQPIEEDTCHYHWCHTKREQQNQHKSSTQKNKQRCVPIDRLIVIVTYTCCDDIVQLSCCGVCCLPSSIHKSQYKNKKTINIARWKKKTWKNQHHQP